MAIGDADNLLAFQRGRSAGLTEGYDIGFEKGKAEGLEEGVYDGRLAGRTEGFGEGRAQGHREGRDEAIDEANVRILGLMHTRAALEEAVREKDAKIASQEKEIVRLTAELEEWKSAFEEVKNSNIEFGESLSRLNVMYMSCASALGTYEQAAPLHLASARAAFQNTYVDETRRRISKNQLRQPPLATVGPTAKKFLEHWLSSGKHEPEVSATLV